jgi:type I restriction enzyme M protein
MSRITQQQLESYLWGAATLLRGTIDAGDYKQFIFPLLFYKRLCDVFDEETLKALRDSGGDEAFAQFPENHRFQIPPEAHWREARKATRDVGRALQQSMRAIETANQNKLYNIFGDAQWTNKDRLSDSMLRDLVEHFSTLELTVANLPEDELGQGYEFLIKKFADDSGHTAAEFYTNRTVVHLMTEMLDVQPGESVYDPTCGSGGMLLSCVTHLRKQGKEWRNVKLFGQERNLMTSSIARMNCFLHGVEDFRVERGDTLAEPKLVQGDSLMKFDVVLANPPYSIKQWDREAFASDPWGRNLYGTPPQGRADYAFQQHILQSLREESGRSIALWPHGLLSREEEAEIRKKLVATDQVEAIVGLGRKLFYNSGMESCLFVCRKKKSKSRRGKILFINAEEYVTRERSQSFLSASNLEAILRAYRSDSAVSGISAFASIEEVLRQNGNLNIKLYAQSAVGGYTDEGVNDSSAALGLNAWISKSNETRDALEDVAPPLRSGRIALEEVANPLCSELFDRSQWKRVRLGDVAHEYASRVDNPSASGFERYIGSDCIDRHAFRIRRWDPAASVKSSMKAFRSGDYLLVRRSLYGSDFRERAPRADFNGICSADILTISENPDRIADGFLTAVLYSRGLWDYIVQHAKGSLTRRIKWRELASYEFDLPPLEQQRRIAEMLWAVDAAEQSYSSLAADLRKAQHSLERSLFRQRGIRTEKISNVASIQRGRFTPRPRDDPKYFGGEMPFIQTAKVIASRVWVDSYDQTLNDLGVSVSKVFPRETIVMVIAGTYVGSVAKLAFESAFTDSLLGIQAKPDILENDYLFYYLRHFEAQVDRLATEVAQRNLSIAGLQDFEITFPNDLKGQRKVVSEIKRFERICEEAQTISVQTKRLKHSLVNQIYPPK